MTGRVMLMSMMTLTLLCLGRAEGAGASAQDRAVQEELAVAGLTAEELKSARGYVQTDEEQAASASKFLFNSILRTHYNDDVIDMMQELDTDQDKQITLNEMKNMKSHDATDSVQNVLHKILESRGGFIPTLHKMFDDDNDGSTSFREFIKAHDEA